MKKMLRRQNSAAMFLTHVSPANRLALPLADESGLSINCVEAAGLPSATLKSTKKINMTSNCLGTCQQAQSLYYDYDDDDERNMM
jgi:hypothetical protein